METESNLNNVQKHRCDPCKKEFSKKSNLKRHVESIHEKGREKCFLCEKEFRNLASHMESTHEKKEPKCEVCGETFKLMKQLRSHRYSKHKIVKKHICEICGQQFVTNFVLVKHKKSLHNDTVTKMFKCDKCYVVKSLEKKNI